MTRRQRFVGLILAAAIGIASNVAASQMPGWLKPHLWVSWPILIVLTIAAIALELRQGKSVAISEEFDALPPIHQIDIDIRRAPRERLFGRDADLTAIASWVRDPRVRVIGVVGLGGVGKSSLAAEVARGAGTEFESVFWVQMVDSPEPRSIAASVIAAMGESLPIDVSGPAVLRTLGEVLCEHRCLVVLDGAETVLDAADQPADGDSSYDAFLSTWMTLSHRSVLLMTSRVTPRVLARRRRPSSARVRNVGGLGLEGARELLASTGVTGSASEVEDAVTLLSGNPQGLLWLADTTDELFHGDLAAALQSNAIAHGDMVEVFDQQVARLSPTQSAILYWLVILRSSTSIDQLRDCLRPAPPMGPVLTALRVLIDRSMAQRTEHGFQVGGLVIELAQAKIVAFAAAELASDEPNFLHSHSLLVPDAADPVLRAQRAMFLRPVLQAGPFDRPVLLSRLHAAVERSRGGAPDRASYLVGNLVNLLAERDTSLDGLDLNGARVWNADFRDVSLRGANLNETDLHGSAFKQAFGSVTCVFALNDGVHLLMGTANGSLCRVRTGDGCVVQHVNAHRGWLRSILQTLDGDVVSAGDDGVLTVWSEGLHRRFSVDAHPGGVQATVLLTPTVVATAGADGYVRAWDVRTGARQWKQLLGSPVTALAAHDDVLLAGTYEGSISALAKNGDITDAALPTTAHSVQAITFSGDGRLVAVGDMRGDVVVLRPRGWTRVTTLSGGSHTRALRFSPSGGHLLASFTYGGVVSWRTDDWRQGQALGGHTSWVWSIDFYDDDRVATGSHDQTLRLWSFSTGELLRTIDGYSNAAFAVACSADTGIAAVGYERSMVVLWNARTHERVAELGRHAGRVGAIGIDRRAEFVASGGRDRFVRCWRTIDGSLQWARSSHRDTVWAVSVSRDGDLVASASGDATCRLWDVPTGRELAVLDGHDHGVWAVAISSGADLVLTGSRDNTARLWDWRARRETSDPMAHPNRVTAVEFLDDAHVATTCLDGLVRVWATDGTLDWQQDIGRDVARSLAVDPTRRRIAVGYQSGRIACWNAVGEDNPTITSAHVGAVWSLAFLDDGAMLSAGDDGVVRVWPVATHEAIELQEPRPYEGLTLIGASGIEPEVLTGLTHLGATLA